MALKTHYQKSLFIFRRDLRLYDNTALNAALALSQQVIAVFIFDPEQINAHPYQSRSGLQFMLESLRDLQQQLHAQGGRLCLFYDKPELVIAKLKQEQQIQAVFVNRDYTPFSRKRDWALTQCCASLQLDFKSYADALLNEPEQVLNNNQLPYQVFTAYHKRARLLTVTHPQALYGSHFFNDGKRTEDSAIIDRFSRVHNNALLGGRRAALAILQQLAHYQDYQQHRDFPALAASTGLSAYLKFGCCSIREAYFAVLSALGVEHGLLRQFYWRDFFTHIAFHYPHVFGHAFHRQFDQIAWCNETEKFECWINGCTGFPIVDAAMRELQQTGWMHNRLRMVVASFLVKDLHISWLWGERYFAQQLLDYDPCVNNGNWQWAASTGCDAQPYFRIFNPWLQQSKFDPDALYLKRWLPELQAFSAKAIHQWADKPFNANYPKPIVDHKCQSQMSKQLFSRLSDGIAETE